MNTRHYLIALLVLCLSGKTLIARETSNPVSSYEKMNLAAPTGVTCTAQIQDLTATEKILALDKIEEVKKHYHDTFEFCYTQLNHASLAERFAVVKVVIKNDSDKDIILLRNKHWKNIDDAFSYVMKKLSSLKGIRKAYHLTAIIAAVLSVPLIWTVIIPILAIIFWCATRKIVRKLDVILKKHKALQENRFKGSFSSMFGDDDDDDDFADDDIDNEDDESKTISIQAGGTIVETLIIPRSDIARFAQTQLLTLS